MNHLILAIATGFYSGKLPKAPGTWGSLAAFVPWYFMRELNLPSYLLTIIAITIVGILVAGSAEKLLDKPDAGPIVIDEFVGMFITLTLAPDHPVSWILGFLLFRFFDIVKPFPVSWFDNHFHGGIGIMMDDVMAGIYGLISLQLIWYLGTRLL